MQDRTFSDGPTHPAQRFEMDPHEPELGSIPEGQHDSDAVKKTGTTTIGISTEDAAVIATDMRASLGGRFVSNKNVQKVEQIHPTAALTLVGSVGGAQSFIRTLRAEANLYETRRGEQISMTALSTLAGNFARGGPFLAINPILGGIDEDGAHVYSIDPAGGVMEDNYTVTGSGLTVTDTNRTCPWRPHSRPPSRVSRPPPSATPDQETVFTSPRSPRRVSTSRTTSSTSSTPEPDE